MAAVVARALAQDLGGPELTGKLALKWHLASTSRMCFASPSRRGCGFTPACGLLWGGDNPLAGVSSRVTVHLAGLSMARGGLLPNSQGQAARLESTAQPVACVARAGHEHDRRARNSAPC